METSIKFIRLSTGEDVVADTTHVSDSHGPDYIVLNNPLKIVYIPNPRDATRVAVSLMQWVFSKMAAEQEFKIMMKDVITMAEASETLIGYYTDFIDSFEEAQKKFDKSNHASRGNHDITDEEWEDMLSEFQHDSSYSTEEPDQENLTDGEGLEMLQQLLEDIKKNGKKNLH